MTIKWIFWACNNSDFSFNWFNNSVFSREKTYSRPYCRISMAASKGVPPLSSTFSSMNSYEPSSRRYTRSMARRLSPHWSTSPEATGTWLTQQAASGQISLGMFTIALSSATSFLLSAPTSFCFSKRQFSLDGLWYLDVFQFASIRSYILSINGNISLSGDEDSHSSAQLFLCLYCGLCPIPVKRKCSSMRSSTPDRILRSSPFRLVSGTWHLPPLTVFFHLDIVKIFLEPFGSERVNGDQHLGRNGFGISL